MNNSLYKGLQKGVFIPIDDHLEAIRDYPVINAISCELRSPLTIIKSNIEYLKKYCNFPDISLVNETFSFCEDSSESIRGFIEKINFLCSSDINHKKPTSEWYSLRLLINQVFFELSQQKLDITRIRFSNSADDFNLFPDRYLFLRILVNLLSNALKFSTPDVELLVSTSGNGISIVVRDSGIGIPSNQVPTIFDPFVRGTNAKKVKGSGLGLSVVANAVKYLNGNITLDSEVGKGTEFRITFPNLDNVSDFVHSSQRNNLSDHFRYMEPEYNKIIRTVFHELRTPIAILKSNIQLLKKLTFEIDEELKDASISRCEAALNDMERFFDRIPILNISIKSHLNVHLPDPGASRLHVN